MSFPLLKIWAGLPRDCRAKPKLESRTYRDLRGLAWLTSPVSRDTVVWAAAPKL